MLPETCTSVYIEGETVKVKIWVSTTGPWLEFQFCDENRTPPQGEMPFTLDYRSPYDVDVDVFRDEDEMQDALVIVEWDNPVPGAKRCVLMLLHWIAEGIAEQVGLLGDYGYDRPSVQRPMHKVSRRKVIFELR